RHAAASAEVEGRAAQVEQRGAAGAVAGEHLRGRREDVLAAVEQRDLAGAVREEGAVGVDDRRAVLVEHGLTAEVGPVSTRDLEVRVAVEVLERVAGRPGELRRRRRARAAD